jgi:NO-binding membrane sensor protein with MHYT domain
VGGGAAAPTIRDAAANRMDDTNPPLNEAAPLLWLVLPLLAGLAGHLVLAFTRDMRRHGGAVATVLLGAAAALALGSGAFAAMALAMSGQPVAYTVGYRADALLAAWAMAVAAAGLLVALMAWRPSPAAVVLGAGLYAAGATAAQVGTVWAAGLLPGLAWRVETLFMAAALQAVLSACALWLAFLGPGRSGRHRRRWRAAAAALFALALIVGPEVVLLAGDMATQIASANAGQVGLRSVKLLGAVVVPALLVLLAGLLHLGGADAAPETRPGHRRRRRRRWWALRP